MITVPLEEISSRIDYGLTASADPSAEGPKFLRITDLQDGRICWESVPKTVCSKKDLEKYRISAGDLFFARTGATTGKCYLVSKPPHDSVFASYLIRLRPNDEADSGYLAHFFTSGEYWNQIRSMSEGAAQPGVNASKLKKLAVPLPPLAEQKRIAKILDAADALRAKRRESLAQLDALLQSTFLEMFGDPVENPKGWNDEEKLGEIADIASGITKGRKTNDQALREVPYLAVANVQDRHLILDHVKTIAATEAEIDRYKLKKNDLLLTEGGDPDKLGRGSLWREEIEECIHQNHVFRVRLNTDRVSPVYLNWIVGSERGKRYFMRSAKQTTGIASINMTQLRAFPLLIPPRKIQEKFSRAIAQQEKQEVKLGWQLREFDLLFSSLQQKAFTGQL